MVTALFTGILGLVYVGLSFFVIKNRFAFKVGLGDAGEERLQRAVRAHGNFIEYVPFALFLMFLCELNVSDIFGAAPDYIYGVGVLLLIGRLLHVVGMVNDRISLLRPVGMVLTILSILIPSIMLIYQFVTA